ncbi:DNA polymerase III subunit delta [Pelagibacteraceae bacterium]|nr:DNA polymerase III subunit delta [Pelagibacteraceae bacterium]MDC0366359.1 DNA polymerase III subunit delta [Pelagibacteraceae bacterium]
MIFKSYVLEQNLKSIDNCKIILFYGENQGLKEEFKKNIKEANKNNEKLNLLQDEIIKNENLLINEISNKSLFNNKKIIFIDQVNEKILNIIEEMAEDVSDEKIVIFAGNLDKKSKLRSYFEKSKLCGIVACYQDNEITIKKIITNKLSDYQGLSTQVINFIIQNTGLNRSKVNNEIEKIKSCFLEKKINLEKIDLLLNIKTNDDFNKLKDEALKGNKIKTNKLLADTVFEPESNIYYLNSINQRINKLYEIEKLKQNNSNTETLVSSLKPPIFWKDKPVLIEQTNKWNENKIKKALEKTYTVELQIKTGSAIKNDLLIKNLMIDLCTVANSA